MIDTGPKSPNTVTTLFHSNAFMIMYYIKLP